MTRVSGRLKLVCNGLGVSPATRPCCGCSQEVQLRLASILMCSNGDGLEDPGMESARLV